MNNDDGSVDLNLPNPMSSALANIVKFPDFLTGDKEADRLILQYGRPFFGIKRPKNYRPRAPKACFLNAFNLAMEERGTYCEGVSVGKSLGFHHAWITLDGEHAIDVTLPDAQDHSYFGIAFRGSQFNRLATSRITDGQLRPVFSDPIDDLLRNFLRDMSVATPSDVKTS